MAESLEYQQAATSQQHKPYSFGALFTALPGLFYIAFGLVCAVNPHISSGSPYVGPLMLMYLAGIFVMPLVLLICLCVNVVRLRRNPLHIVPLMINLVGLIVGGFGFYSLVTLPERNLGPGAM
jgi:hypothetical protein